jgi:hydrogenase nickel incorporation protein HypA/HybF
MHELGLTRNIVSIVSEKAQGAKVTRVILEIGKLSAVLPDAIRFCFDIVSQGTVLDGADLEIIETRGKGKCQACGIQFELEHPYGQCPCGSADITLLDGQQLLIKQMVTA